MMKPIRPIRLAQSLQERPSSIAPLCRQEVKTVRHPSLLNATLRFGMALLLISTLTSAQSGSPKYDNSTETKLKGTVEEMKVPASAKEITHLLVKNGTDTLDIYLCPKSFIDDMGISFTKGDEVAFTGSKVKQGPDELILAKEVVKGSDTLVLRDDKGNPVWNWKR
jgi:hypothetical protein